MAITLTTSQRAAANNPSAEPAILLDFVTASAEVYHLATQPCCYGGVQYAARLLGVSDLQTGVANVAYELPSVKTLSVDIADADGFFGTKRPSWLRGQPITYREVFLDVDSAAVRTFGFTVTGQGKPTSSTFRVQAEDILAPVRRKLIPSTDVLITTSLYPNLSQGISQPGADGNNRPIPWMFGRTYVPLYYVDQSSDGSHIYVACVGSAMLVGSGSVTDWFDGGFSQIGDPSNTAPDPNYPNDGNSTFPWSVRYAVRNSTRDDGTTISIPVTEIVVHPKFGPGNTIGRRLADLTWTRGSSAYTTPDEVLTWMLRDCFGGAHVDPVLTVDSDSLLAAHSFYLANSIYFDGALIEQRPLEDWLAQWQHDSLTRLILRDKIYLAPCNSRTAVASICDANVLDRSITYDDVPVSQEFSRRVLYYKERTRDADYGQGDGSQQGDARGGSFVRWDVGSGAELALASPFIGRPSIAGRVVQYWAKQAALGERIYKAPSTTRTIDLEDGDLVSFTNSAVGTLAQPCEVLGTARAGGVYTYTLMETDPSVWSAAVGADPDFGAFYQRVLYNGDSHALGSTLPVYTLTVSHQMKRTPGHIKGYVPFELITTSLVVGPTTNDSQFTVSNQYVFPGPVNAETALLGWYLYV